MERMVSTNSLSLSCGVWLMLMRNTSAPAVNRAAICSRLDDAGPRVARILVGADVACGLFLSLATILKTF